MKTNYFDIEDILATAERVPSRFNCTVPGIGHLDNQPGKPITKDTKVDLPLWLGMDLAAINIMESDEETGEEMETSIIDLILPDSLSPVVKNAIKSDPVSIDLHAILPHYYKLAIHWCSLYNDLELANVMKKLCKERTYELNNFASNTTKQINNNFIMSLDEFEKKLYKKTVESNRNLRDWLNE